MYYCQDWKKGNDEKTSQPVAAIPEMDEIHAGALAPKFVFDAKAEPEPASDDRGVYLKRLICVLCQRFVVLSRPQEPRSLDESGGVPETGAQYAWRYWDNRRHVHEVPLVEFRDSAGTFAMNEALVHTGTIQYRDVEKATMLHGMPPGDFAPPDGAPMWMRVVSGRPDGSSWSERTDLASFLDHAWSFRHHGTTRVPLWDANLFLLAGLAGVPPNKTCRACMNRVEASLRRCTRCKLVYYCRDGNCQREDWKDHKNMCNYFK